VPAKGLVARTASQLTAAHHSRLDVRLRGAGFALSRVWSIDDSTSEIGTGDLAVCTSRPESFESQGIVPPSDTSSCIAGGSTFGLLQPQSTATTCDGGPGVDTSLSGPRDFDCGTSDYLPAGSYSVFMDGHRSGLRPAVGSVSVAFEFLTL
jgi:hypothetical protein